MFMFMNIVMFIVLACTSLYTISYGVWTWKKKNKLGAVMIFVVAMTVLMLPVYTLYIRLG
ncbi:MAG: hypothetical protein UW75_C0064G0002 [Parcubacteria group bacterium GW2011_GWF2_44_8]|nr:MAG: hypothetical protein UW75_C0064G0002 [Parcubacteria group bacterium GW2011_GWF2_44_8]